MARFFEQFPLMAYDIKADYNYKLVPDIFRRVKAKNKIKNKNIYLCPLLQLKQEEIK